MAFLSSVKESGAAMCRGTTDMLFCSIISGHSGPV